MKNILIIITSAFATITAAQPTSTIFHENGKVLRELVPLEGTDTLLEKIYFENGQLNNLYHIVDNQRAGKALTYDEDGNLRIKRNYELGNLNGLSQTFYPSGQIGRSEVFRDGFHVDTAVYYQQDGLMTKRIVYKDPCKFGSRECNQQVTIYEKGKAVYSLEVNDGVKSSDHNILDEELYSKLMASESKVSLIEKGKAIFQMNCGMCHRMNQPLIGPALECITERKDQDEIKRIIEGANNHSPTKLNPQEYESLIEFIEKKCP